MHKSVRLDEGLMIIGEAIQKAKRIVEGYPDTKFIPRIHEVPFVSFVTPVRCVYVLCTSSGLDSGNQMLLYDRFEKSLVESITNTVLPSLAAKDNEVMLRELVLMWSNYKLMVRWLCRFFEYLDRDCCFSLSDTSVNCFRNLVFKVLERRIQAAAFSLISQERQGNQIDLKLLVDVLNICVEIDPSFNGNFEQAMLEETASFYSRLALQWILCDSFSNYLQKVNWCIKQEKERASRYLHSMSVEKLIQVVRCELLGMMANKIEKKQSENFSQLDYQEILSKCAGLSLEEGSSVSTLVESLSVLMTKSAHIH